jgi:outer membrane protein assembly factor BamB
MRTNKRLLIIFALTFLFSGGVIRTTAQEVVVAYADPVGSIIRYRVADGSEISRIQRVYRVGATTYLPTMIGVADASSYIVVFGERFLARVRVTDGALVWVVDAGVALGLTTYFVADIAVASGQIFLCNTDPGGRIAKYRAADGALIWSTQRAIQEGTLRHLPLRLAASGADSVLVVLGSKYLSKVRQSDGTALTQMSIPLTYLAITWGIGDLASGSTGITHVSNLDPTGTIRKFTDGGALIWSVSQTYRVGLIRYLPTKLAAVGADPVMVLFGDRYLARMNATNGQILWTRDVGVTIGATTYSAKDLAGISSP